MEYSLLLSQALILIGASILGYALYPTTRVLRELPPGPVKTQWKVLRIFLLFFIAGYLIYLVIFASEAGTSHLLVASIFFFGACFALLVCMPAHGTVQDIKRVVALEIENITDPLMEIYNRRYLERRLEEEFTRAKRYKLPLSVLMLDIDHFKQINNTYGHATGDLVLKEIGDLLKNSIRSVDIPARYGGEEAVVLFLHTGEEDSEIIAERIRRRVETHSFPTDASHEGKRSLRTTISIGIASLSEDCSSAGQLLNLADTAMYRAKETGRNRTIVFRCEKETVPSGVGRNSSD